MTWNKSIMAHLEKCKKYHGEYSSNYAGGSHKFSHLEHDINCMVWFWGLNKVNQGKAISRVSSRVSAQ